MSTFRVGQRVISDVGGEGVIRKIADDGYLGVDHEQDRKHPKDKDLLYWSPSMCKKIKGGRNG